MQPLREASLSGAGPRVGSRQQVHSRCMAEGSPWPAAVGQGVGSAGPGTVRVPELSLCVPRQEGLWSVTKENACLGR